jgi:hypothetical protein
MRRHLTTRATNGAPKLEDLASVLSEARPQVHKVLGHILRAVPDAAFDVLAHGEGGHHQRPEGVLEVVPMWGVVGPSQPAESPVHETAGPEIHVCHEVVRGLDLSDPNVPQDVDREAVGSTPVGWHGRRSAQIILQLQTRF